MSDAPERIGLVSAPYSLGWGLWNKDEDYFNSAGVVEYVRADLAPSAEQMRADCIAAIQAHADKWIPERPVYDGEEYLRGEEIVLHEAIRLIAALPPAPLTLADAARVPEIAALTDELDNAYAAIANMTPQERMTGGLWSARMCRLAAAIADVAALRAIAGGTT